MAAALVAGPRPASRVCLNVSPMPVGVALLPSPLLGPAVWEPVAERLRQQGWRAGVCAATAGAANAQDVLDAFVERLAPERAWVLVPHSNAGLYVPRLAAERNVVGNVFVDAALAPVAGSTALAPAALYDVLRTRVAADGLLPRWTEWWDDADVDALFPSREVRRRVEGEQPRLPLAYFGESLQVPPGWAGLPSAYVAFGDTYADERRLAEGRGWPVRTLPGRHLHMLVDPDEVAESLTDLLALLSIDGGPGARPAGGSGQRCQR